MIFKRYKKFTMGKQMGYEIVIVTIIKPLEKIKNDKRSLQKIIKKQK